MGAWGIRALNSDEGLDVLDFLGRSYLPGHTVLRLEEAIAAMKDAGFFGDTFVEIDLYYDNSALALAELYLDWRDAGERPQGESWTGITAVTAGPEAVGFLLRYLRDLWDEVPDEDGEREIAALWRDSPSWDQWRAHLDALIQRLEQGGV